jgi:hypothetical protein
MDPEVKINAFNKEVRGLFNRGAFSLVHADTVPSHANIIGTRMNIRRKHFGSIGEVAKARLIIQDSRTSRITEVYNTPSVSHASIRILISFAAINKIIWCGLQTVRSHSSKDTFWRDLYARIS